MSLHTGTQGLTSGLLCEVAEAQVRRQGLGLAGQTCTLGLRELRAAATGAPAEQAAPPNSPLAGHWLGPVARQAGSTGAQAEQGRQGQGCSNGDAQEGQLHTGIQQTCMGSMAPSAPFGTATVLHLPPSTYLVAGGRWW